MVKLVFGFLFAASLTVNIVFLTMFATGKSNDQIAFNREIEAVYDDASNWMDKVLTGNAEVFFSKIDSKELKVRFQKLHPDVKKKYMKVVTSKLLDFRFCDKKVTMQSPNYVCTVFTNSGIDMGNVQAFRVWQWQYDKRIASQVMDDAEIWSGIKQAENAK